MRALLLVGLIGLALAAPLPEATATASHTVHMVFQSPALFLFRSDDTMTGVLVVSVGDTVTFVSDAVNHQVVNGLDALVEPQEGSLEVGPLHLNAFDTGNIPLHASGTITITEPGVYPYYCAVGLHRFTGMRGLIVAS